MEHSKFAYSPSRNGFYAREMEPDFVAAGTWPGDLIDVSDEDYASLMQAPSSGLTIVPGPDGYPTTVEAPKPSDEEIEANNIAVRDSLISAAALRIAPLQDAVDLGVATTEEESALLAWKRYRVDVNRVDLSVQAPQWPTVPSSES